MTQSFISLLRDPDAKDGTGGNQPGSDSTPDPKLPIVTATQAAQVIDISQPLVLRRLSSLANNRNSFCYAIVSGFPAGASGSYATPNGLLMYSPARLGDHDKPFTAKFRVANVHGKQFINLVDPNVEQYGALQQTISMGKRIGINDISLGNQAASELFRMAGLTIPAQAAAAPQPQQ